MDAAAGLFASPCYLAKAGEPDHPRELSGFGFVGAGDPETLTLWRPHAIGDFPIHQRARLATEPETMAAILTGSGIGVLSLSFARARLQDGQLVRVLPEWEVLDPVTISKEIDALPQCLRMLSL